MKGAMGHIRRTAAGQQEQFAILLSTVPVPQAQEILRTFGMTDEQQLRAAALLSAILNPALADGHGYGFFASDNDDETGIWWAFEPAWEWPDDAGLTFRAAAYRTAVSMLLTHAPGQATPRYTAHEVGGIIIHGDEADHAELIDHLRRHSHAGGTSQAWFALATGLFDADDSEFEYDGTRDRAEAWRDCCAWLAIVGCHGSPDHAHLRATAAGLIWRILLGLPVAADACPAPARPQLSLWGA